MTPTTQTQDKAGQAASGLGRAIADLLREMVVVVEAANDGQLIELDIVAMRITVLCDALSEAGPDARGLWRKELGDLSKALAVLDTVLRKQNVQLQLNIEQLRKQLSPAD
jgi:hypothetical protein